MGCWRRWSTRRHKARRKGAPPALKCTIILKRGREVYGRLFAEALLAFDGAGAAWRAPPCVALHFQTHLSLSLSFGPRRMRPFCLMRAPLAGASPFCVSLPSWHTFRTQASSGERRPPECVNTSLTPRLRRRHGARAPQRRHRRATISCAASARVASSPMHQRQRARSVRPPLAPEQKKTASFQAAQALALAAERGAPGSAGSRVQQKSCCLSLRCAIW